MIYQKTEAVKLAASGQWPMILQDLAKLDDKQVSKKSKSTGAPCPLCGGTDRYSFKDARNGDWACRGCGKGGDGFSLLMQVNGWEFKTAVDRVDEYFGGIAQDDDAIKQATAVREGLQLAEEAKQARKREQAKAAAGEVFARASAYQSHPYAEKKKLTLDALTECRQQGSVLIIPARNAAGEIMTVQRVQGIPDNTGKYPRLFHKGAAKKGGFLMFGRDTKTILIGEGLATVDAAWQLNGSDCLAVCAFDSGNLPTVSQTIREQHPAADMVICADNDDAGIKAAKAAASATGASISYPPDGHNDWSDYFLSGGEQSPLKVLMEKSSVALTGNVIPITTKKKSPERPNYHHYSSTGSVLSTLENFRALLDFTGVAIRYNEMSKREEISIPGVDASGDNEINVNIAHVESLAATHGFSHGRAAAFIPVVADENRYHPVRDWILSKPWDGVSRIGSLCDTIQTKDATLRNILVYRWLLSAVAAAFKSSGFWSKGVLTFQGAQSIGKTSWFRRLFPVDSGYGLDGVCLDPQNKDSINRVVSHWLIELGELESTMKKDVAALKAFITNQVDIYRRPYARAESEYHRRTVFFASVNSHQFLKDDTGNTRYWCLKVDSLNYQHDIDMQQLWAEIYEKYKAGEQWHLTSEEAALLESNNAEFVEIDPIEELILNRYDLHVARTERYTATDVMHIIGYEKPTRADCIRCGRVLTTLFGESKKTNGRKCFQMPPAKQLRA